MICRKSDAWHIRGRYPGNVDASSAIWFTSAAMKTKHCMMSRNTLRDTSTLWDTRCPYSDLGRQLVGTKWGQVAPTCRSKCTFLTTHILAVFQGLVKTRVGHHSKMCPCRPYSSPFTLEFLNFFLKFWTFGAQCLYFNCLLWWWENSIFAYNKA